MGGSGSSSIFGGIRPNVACGNLLIKTQLHSPNPSVIDLLIIGMKLELVLQSPTGPCNAIFNGVVAGTVLNYELLTLIDCMQKGFKYVAIVRSIKGGNCAITITADN